MEKFDVCVKSGLCTKSLLERAKLLHYAEGKNKIRIVIDYDPVAEEGFMNVFESMTIPQFQKGE